MSTVATPDVDAIVIGAGFGGIYMLHKLRNERGLSVKAFEKGGGVGGTWYFNKYPGAKSDTEGFVYRYSFDKDLLQEWDWNTRYLDQPDVLAYLEHVVDRYDLGRDIQLNTEVTSAVFDDDTELWTVTTDDGKSLTARYLVNALGLLAKSNIPDIPGRDTFAGPLVHTNAWPENLDITGKRVGVIGTGSTGTQFIVAAAKIADHLTVFQRSPQYCVPSGNGPVDQAEVDRTKQDFDAIWDQVRNSVVAFGFTESDVEAMSVSEEERRRVFQENWDKGNGFRFMFGTFCDIATNPEANAAAAAFIRSKIAEIVDDPETARKLTPTDLYAKRPLCNEGYYETYNRDNVTLVPLAKNPIVEYTRTGLRTAEGEMDFDVIVLATGFDAFTGALSRIDIRGVGGQTLKDKWRDGPQTYMGVQVSGFPNLLINGGPHGKGGIGNSPRCAEPLVWWLGGLLGYMHEHGLTRVEADAEAEKKWTAHVNELASKMMASTVKSYSFGDNIPGKPHVYVAYSGTLPEFIERLKENTESGYEGFSLS